MVNRSPHPLRAASEAPKADSLITVLIIWVQ